MAALLFERGIVENKAWDSPAAEYALFGVSGGGRQRMTPPSRQPTASVGRNTGTP